MRNSKAIIATALTAGLLLSGWAVAGGGFPGLGAGGILPAASLYDWEDDDVPNTGPTIELEWEDYYPQEEPEWYEPEDEEPEWYEYEQYEPEQEEPEQEEYEEEYSGSLYQYPPEYYEYGCAQEELPLCAEPVEHGYAVDVLPYMVVRPNPYVMPNRERFTIMEAFELNGYTLNNWSISNVQMDVQPPGSGYHHALMTIDQEKIRAAWEILSQLEVQRVHRPEPLPSLPYPRSYLFENPPQVELSGTSVWVGFQFSSLNRNWHSLMCVQMFGPVYILGHGPFEFAPGSSKQPFIDLFHQLAR